MKCGDLQQLRPDPEWTEENGHSARIPDGVKQAFAALGMITVDYHRIERFAPDGIFERFFPLPRTSAVNHEVLPSGPTTPRRLPRARESAHCSMPPTKIGRS